MKTLTGKQCKKQKQRPPMCPQERKNWELIRQSYNYLCRVGAPRPDNDCALGVAVKGLCCAVRLLHDCGAIDYPMQTTMLDRLVMHTPRGCCMHRQWWPYDEVGAEKRIAWISRLLKKYPPMKKQRGRES